MPRASREFTEDADGRWVTPKRVEVERDQEGDLVRVHAGNVQSSRRANRSGVLGRYQILARVGEGGMGRAYAAWDPLLRRKVVLKLLSLPHPCEHARVNFEREVQALAVLSHPNIVTIYDYCKLGETCFAVMEFLDGSALRELMRQGALPATTSLQIGSHIVEGLAAAHQHGIVHRDVKPENILVTQDGRVKLLDFGLSKRCAPREAHVLREPVQSEEAPGRLIGTVAYMSPEQARGDDVDVRSDIFSFGIVLHEMLTGVHPFVRDTAADTLLAIMRNRPVGAARGDRLSDTLSQIARRCMRKEPQTRYVPTSRLADLMRKLCRQHLCPGC